MLTALRKEYPDSGYVFTTERGTPFTPDAINRHLKGIGKRAKLPFPVHFHMLRSQRKKAVLRGNQRRQ
jgi:type 1 fimbriae regulatory protein FimB/type 1 fimbriae regulatory protein FimE